MKRRRGNLRRSFIIYKEGGEGILTEDLIDTKKEKVSTITRKKNNSKSFTHTNTTKIDGGRGRRYIV